MTFLFSTEEHKKASIFTVIICGIILLLFFLIRWSVLPVTAPLIQDQIEINLGNDQEGFGEEQPLIKGKPSLVKEKDQAPTTSNNNSRDNIHTDENNDKDAAAVNKSTPQKTIVKNNNPSTIAPDKTKPSTQKPKLIYQGPALDKNGNNTEIDNGFTSQGKILNGGGDLGTANGKPKVIAINKSMLKDYQFEGDLGTEKIYARINISTAGIGSFVKIEKKSTSFDAKYKQAIINCLPKIKFEAGKTNYDAIIMFDFKVN